MVRVDKGEGATQEGRQVGRWVGGPWTGPLCNVLTLLHTARTCRSNMLLLRQFMGMDYMKKTFMIFSFRDFTLTALWISILPISYLLAGR